MFTISDNETAALLIFTVILAFIPEVYIDQGMAWMIFACISFLCRFRITFTRWSLPLFIGALVVSVVHGSYYVKSDLGGDYFSLAGLVFFISAFGAGLNFRQLDIGKYARICILLCLIALPRATGLFYNGTIEGFFAVFLAALANSPAFSLIAVIIAILRHGASASIIGVLVLYSQIAFRSRKPLETLWLNFLGAVMATSIWHLAFAGKVLTDRIEMWKLSLSYWREQHFWLGIGYNRFGAMATKVQMLGGFQPTELWVSLHNDWLQMLLELGPLFIFFALLWWDLIVSCFNSWSENKNYFVALTALAIFMGVYFPLRIPIFWFLFGHITQRVLDERWDR